MQNRMKNKIITIAFVLYLGFFAIMCTVRFIDPIKTSDAERRPLAQFPKNITWESIVDKTFVNKFEDYAVDQFPFREFFRGLKAGFQMNVLQIKENNGLALQDGYIAAISKNFNEQQVKYSLGRLSYVYDSILKDNGGNKYVAIIPDKNYFFGKEYGYPAPDYAELVEQVKETLPEMTYIDLFSELTLEDYYRTDTHWSQDKLGKVVDKLAAGLGVSDALISEYEK